MIPIAPPYDGSEYRRKEGQHSHSGLQSRIGDDHERNLRVRQNHKERGSDTDCDNFLDAKLQFHDELPPRSS